MDWIYSRLKLFPPHLPLCPKPGTPANLLPPFLEPETPNTHLSQENPEFIQLHSPFLKTTLLLYI